MATITDRDIITIRDHYLIAALWASNDDRSDHDIPLDRDYGIENVSQVSKIKITELILRFIELAGSKLDLYFEDHDLEQLGHDLFLTQNGHGTGFWDRKYSHEGLGDFLSEICDQLGESLPYVADNNEIEFYTSF
jgi:hypothetical protein